MSAQPEHCDQAYLFPFVPMFMSDTCSFFMQCDGLNLLSSSKTSSSRHAQVFPPMWTAEYLMESSLFSASSSFVYRTKPHQASPRSCQETAIVEVFHRSIKSRRDFPAFSNNSPRIWLTTLYDGFRSSVENFPPLLSFFILHLLSLAPW